MSSTKSTIFKLRSCSFYNQVLYVGWEVGQSVRRSVSQKKCQNMSKDVKNLKKCRKKYKKCHNADFEYRSSLYFTTACRYIHNQTLYRYHNCGTLGCLISVPSVKLRYSGLPHEPKKKVKTSITFFVCLGLKCGEKKFWRLLKTIFKKIKNLTIFFS